MRTWYKAAEYCEVIFGSFVNWDEGFFICPECADCVLRSDWEKNHINWNVCPICECNFIEIN